MTCRDALVNISREVTGILEVTVDVHRKKLCNFYLLKKQSRPTFKIGQYVSNSASVLEVTEYFMHRRVV